MLITPCVKSTLHRLVAGPACLAIAVFVALALAPQTGIAADRDGAWPTRPITMVIPFTPGAITDTLGRRIANHLSGALGANVIVENKPGAGANLGAGFVANAKPDGYTLLFSTFGNLIIEAASSGQFNLQPVAMIGPMTVVLLVRPDLPFQTLDAFVDYARANPKKISLASIGVGSSYHLMIEQMNALGGLDMVHIPYRGGAPAMADFLGGRVDGMLATWSFARPYVNDNRARLIAVTNAQPSSELPGVPTVNEKAIPGARLTDGLAIFGPRGLPAPVVTRINEAVRALLEQPDAQAWLKKEGVTPAPMSADAFAAMLKTETAPLHDLIVRNNIALK